MTPGARFVLAAVGAALTVASCAGVHPLAPSEAVMRPCVSVAVEPEPVGPELTDTQQMALDRATIQALGAPLAAAVILYRDVTHPEWGRRAAAGLDAMRETCDP